MIGQLGCGEYTLYLQSRGGGNSRIMEVPWKTLTWARVLDDTSQTVVTNAQADCCELLSVMRPWQHEISINRSPPNRAASYELIFDEEGQIIYGHDHEVWVGPVYSPQPQQPDVSSYESDIQIQARDLSAWFDKRLIHNDHLYTSGTDDIGSMFSDLCGDALSVDDSPQISFGGPIVTGILAVRNYLADSNLLCGPELRTLAGLGVDWTMLVRQLLSGGTTIFNPDAQIGPFLDEHFAIPPTPIPDGSAQYNALTYIGSGTSADGGNAVFEQAVDEVSQLIFGVLEATITDITCLDNTSAAAGAASGLALGSQIIQITNAVLSPDAPFTMDQLVPGTVCQLELEQTCTPVSGPYRLSRMDVTVDPTQEPNETVSLTFQPLGSNG